MQRQQAQMQENETVRPERCRLPPPQPYPWLLYFHGDGQKDQTFGSISDPATTYPRIIPELGGTNHWGIHHGWHALCRPIANDFQLFLWNPTTLQKISLPVLKYNDPISFCIFSSPPTDLGCMVLLFVLKSTSIIYCQLGDEDWIKVDYAEKLQRILEQEDGPFYKDTYLNNPVYCNGCLYAEAYYEKLLVIIEKIGPHGLNIKSTHVLLPESPSYSCTFVKKLLESNGELFRIEMLFGPDLEIKEIVAIVVHRLDFSQMVWEKVESIKDRVFFLSIFDCSFACQSINPEIEGGRMYLTIGHSNFMYIYTIEDKSLMLSRPFSDLPANHSYPIWFMQDCRRTDSGRTELESNKEVRTTAEITGKETSVAMHSKENGNITTHISKLPPDIANLIAERLYVVDYLHFRATNRLLRSVAPPVKRRSALPRLDDLFLSPLFVYLEKDSVLTFVHPKHGLNYKYNINLPRDLQEGSILCYSKGGWLLMAMKQDLTFFFNPFTKEVLPLANGPRTKRNTQCIGFSHPPTSSECVVVEFDKIKLYPVMIAHITRLGEEEWGRFEFEDSDFPLCRGSPVFFRGAIYYLGKKGNLGVLEIIEFGESVSWKVLDQPQVPCRGYGKSFLLECNGNLLSVFEGRFGKWVRVYKLNESAMTWMEVENLGDYMVFVSHSYSFSAVANIPGMENKIYFPRLSGQSIVFYSLETKKCHTFDSEDEVIDFHCAREQLHCGWIEPRWH